MTTDQDPEKKPQADENPKSEENSSSPASFWDESVILRGIRRARSERRSPREFFNKKWKQKLSKPPGNEKS